VIHLPHLFNPFEPENIPDSFGKPHSHPLGTCRKIRFPNIFYVWFDFAISEN